MSYGGESMMDRVMRNPIGAGLIALAAIVLLMMALSIVPETRQGIVLRLGKADRIINGYDPTAHYGNTGAGLIATLPFFEEIVWIDKRILDIDMDPQEVLSTDQLRLKVDAYARYRIVDPLRMYNTSRTVEQVSKSLRPLLASALSAELGKRQSAELLTPARDKVMDNIKTRLQMVARQYGAQIVDVRIKRTDLSEGTPLQSAYQRMRSARYQEALTIEAQGRKQAQIIEAEADAKAAEIYAAAFNKDPEFYDFYRAMQSYKLTFIGPNGVPPKGSTNVILSPSNDYLRQFRGGK